MHIISRGLPGPVRRLAFVAAALLGLLFTAQAHAATGSLYANGITSPGGSVTLGANLWVADHALGFCRTDASAAGAAAPFTVNQGVCNLSAVSPGQPSFDSTPARNFVYVPDNSSKSQGVWRLTFNPTTNRVGSPALMAGGANGLAGNRATATALTADGNTLYVGFLKNGNIIKVTNPGGASQTATLVAHTSDGRRLSAMALVGDDLYLAEGGAVTVVSGVSTCTGTCVAEPTGVQSAAPTALAADSAHGLLYVAEGGTVFRYAIATDTQDVLATKSDAATAFANVTGLSLDSADNLYVGDDPTAGAQILQGHIYKIAAASTTAAEVPGTPGTPGAPPPTPALTTGTLYANGITSPGGSLTLGSNLWVADHALGFCRTDATAAGAAAPFAINQNVCNLSAVSPGQPSFDSTPARNFVYVPDNSSKSQGVWRLTFNPTTNTVGSPTLMAGGAGGLTGNRATATALTADGNTLYVGFIKNGNIIKVTNPGGPSQTATTVAKTSDGRGLSAMALVGGDLYLAEGGAVTVVPNIGLCAGACVAEPTASSATSPTALAANPATHTLYVAETPASTSTVLRLHIDTGVEDVLATGSDTGTAFRNVTGLSLDGGGNLYVGDDPTAGAQILQGHIYKVAPTP